MVEQLSQWNRILSIEVTLQLCFIQVCTRLLDTSCPWPQQLYERKTCCARSARGFQDFWPDFNQLKQMHLTLLTRTSNGERMGPSLVSCPSFCPLFKFVKQEFSQISSFHNKIQQKNPPKNCLEPVFFWFLVKTVVKSGYFALRTKHIKLSWTGGWVGNVCCLGTLSLSQSKLGQPPAPCCLPPRKRG